MEYVIGVIIVITVVLGGVFWWMSQKNKRPIETNAILKQELRLDSSTFIEDEMNQLMIHLEQLPAEAISDERKLMEITDSKVLARVNNLVPALFQAGNAGVSAVQASGQVLYQAIIPAGAKLANSQDMVGAVRGIYHGVEGVKGHANLVPVKNTANIAASTAAAAIGVASMVVGQYYMTQISAELGEISAGISRIADFQDNEYRSRVFALVAQIKKVATFQVDILDNNELRLIEIANLNNWEQECIQLLGQANLTIVGFSKKNDLGYDEYEKELCDAQSWLIYQKTLTEVMVKIVELKHTLHFGAVSREQCGALFPTYIKQVQDALSQLGSWHQAQVKKFQINVEEANRKRVGFDGFIHMIPGWINEENKYRSVCNNTVKNIVTQTNGYDIQQKNVVIDLYQEDVKIIAKGGKIYYLPIEEAQ